jgi:hypothetical protein
MDQKKNDTQPSWKHTQTSQNPNREPVEGPRFDEDAQNRSGESDMGGGKSNRGGGISNRSMDEELIEQDQLPERGMDQSER